MKQNNTSSVFKRVKERSVLMAVEKVEEWRHLFQNGKHDNQGKLKKLTLQQAAEEVGIPKKTLEDYHQLIKKAKEIQPIEQLYDRKMGYLRQLIKQSQNFKQNNMEIQTEDLEQDDFQIDNELPKQIEQIDQLDQIDCDFEEYCLKKQQTLVKFEVCSQQYLTKQLFNIFFIQCHFYQHAKFLFILISTICKIDHKYLFEINQQYFNLENDYNYDQNSVVMTVHTRPQLIQIQQQKKVDPWENETLSCDSDQETDDEEF